MPRKLGPFSSPTKSALKNFEDRTTATLEAQDRLLERMEQRLQAPVLNGGFEDLNKKIDKVEFIQDQLLRQQETSGKQISDIHMVIYDPEKGMYMTLKSHTRWIEAMTKSIKWAGALFLTGLLSGIGKLIYDFISGHIHIAP